MQSASDRKDLLLGTAALLVSLCFLSLFFQAPHSLVGAGALLAIHFFPKRRNQIFLVATVCSWCLVWVLWQTVRGLPLFSYFHERPLAWALLLVLANLLCFGLGFVLTAVRGWKGILLIGAVYYGTLCLGISDPEFSSVAPQAALALTGLLRGFFVSWLFVVMAAPKDRYERTELLLACAPFWSSASKMNFIPVLPWFGAGWKEAPTRAELTASQIAGLRLIGYGLLAGIAHYAIRVFALGDLTAVKELGPWFERKPSLELGHLFLGFEQLPSVQPHAWQRWAAIFAHFVQTYLGIAYHFALTVAVARLAGFRLPAMFQEPWRADSMANFYGRLLYYYNRVLMQIFYPLTKPALGWIKNRQHRIVAGVWLAVGLGGFVFHFAEDTLWPRPEGLSETLAIYARSAAYFFTLSSFIALSVLTRDKRSRPFYRRLRPLLYCLIWALVLTLSVATRHTNSSWVSYFAYMRGLISL